MKHVKPIVFAIIVMALLAFNNLSDVSKASYDAYLSGSLNLWQRALDVASINYQQNPSKQTKFEWLMVEYGILNATMKDQNEDIFDQYIDNAVDKGIDLIDEGYNIGECKAILSALTGLKIAYSPIKGMFLGPKSSSYIMEALEHDPKSPIVQQLYGNHQNFTPEMWGGNPDNAVAAYEKAIALYDEKGHINNWMYLDAHAWLGIMHKKAMRPEEATKVWAKVLALEPDYGWVKYNLLPSLESVSY